MSALSPNISHLSTSTLSLKISMKMNIVQTIAITQCTAQLDFCHNQEENTNCHLLLREKSSGLSRGKKINKKQVWSEFEAAEIQESMSNMSTVQHVLHLCGLRGCCPRSSWSDDEKVWPLTPRILYLLSHMQVGVWFCGIVIDSGTGALKKINGIMKKEDYLQILHETQIHQTVGWFSIWTMILNTHQIFWKKKWSDQNYHSGIVFPKSWLNLLLICALCWRDKFLPGRQQNELNSTDVWLASNQKGIDCY